MEQCVAPTVLESNVPERTQRRGEYGARVSGREITVCVFTPSPLKQQEQTKPVFRGVLTVFCSKGGGKPGFGAAFFLFRFFFSISFPKRGFCVFLLRWSVLRTRRKDDGRRGRSEGATEAESRLFDAVIKREEAHDQFAKSLRHIHTSGEASR